MRRIAINTTRTPHPDVVNPLVAGDGGIKVRPEKMETEKLYHCIFKDKVMLAYIDGQKVLHCYEIEEKEIVKRIRGCDAGIEGILEEYMSGHGLK